MMREKKRCHSKWSKSKLEKCKDDFECEFYISKFYPYEMTIQESYCHNSECQCREVKLIFLKDKGKKLFSINFSLT